jgi:hypothetical protein
MGLEETVKKVPISKRVVVLRHKKCDSRYVICMPNSNYREANMICVQITGVTKA